MSLKVLIIPEAYPKDRLILKPIIKALFTYLDKPNAKIHVYDDPSIYNITTATDWNKLHPVLKRHSYYDIVLLIVDRDGEGTGRDHTLQHLC